MLDAVLLEEVGSTLHNEWGEGSLERLSGVEMLLVDDEQGGSDAGDEAMDEQDVAGHHDGEWGGGSGRIMTSSSYRPPSSYSRVSPRTGTPLALPWMAPPRPATDVPYVKAKASVRPSQEGLVPFKGLLEGGSALDRQALKTAQSDAFPRPSTHSLPPLRTHSAADAQYSVMERYGPMRGVDEAWASLRESRFWHFEHGSTSEQGVARVMSQPLKDMEYSLRPPRPQDAQRHVVVSREKTAHPTPGTVAYATASTEAAHARRLPVLGPKHVEPKSEYNHVLSLPPVDRAAILQTPRGSLGVKASGTVSFRDLGQAPPPSSTLARKAADGDGDVVVRKRAPRVTPAVPQTEASPTGLLLRPDTTKSVTFREVSAKPRASWRAASPSSPASPPRSRAPSSRAPRMGSESVPLEKRAATVWWLDKLQADEEKPAWVPLHERVRPPTSERERVAFVLGRERDRKLQRIVDHHRAADRHVLVDEFDGYVGGHYRFTLPRPFVEDEQGRTILPAKSKPGTAVS